MAFRLWISDVTASSITISYEGNNPSSFPHFITNIRGPMPPSTKISENPPRLTAAESGSYIFTGLEAGTEYEVYGIVALSGVRSIGSIVERATTLPTTVSVDSVSQSGAVLSWADNTRNSGGLSVAFVSADPDTSLRANEMVSLPGSAGTVALENLAAAVEYTYQLTFAADNDGDTAVMFELRFRTLEPEPPMFSSDRPLTYLIIRHDRSTVDVTREVVKFKLSYGAKPEEDFSGFLLSDGDVELNDWREKYKDDYADWNLLCIFARGREQFACVILEKEYKRYGKMALKTQLLGAYNLSARDARVSVGAEDVLLEDYLKSVSFGLSRVPEVDMPRLYVAAGFGYPGVPEVVEAGGGYDIVERFQRGDEKFLDDLSAFGSLFLFERRLEAGFRAYPIVGLRDDDRGPMARVDSSKLVRDKDFDISRRSWRYDSQAVNVARAPIKTVNNSRGFGSTLWRTSRSGIRGQADGRRYYWYAYLSFAKILGSTDGGNVLRWNSIRSEGRDSGGNFRRAEAQAPDYGRQQILVLGGEDDSSHASRPPNFSLTFSVTVRQSLEVEEIVVGAQEGESVHGALPTSSIAIPESGANGEASVAAIEDNLAIFSALSLEVLEMTLLLPQDGPMRELELEPGSLVYNYVGDRFDRALLMHVEFQHRGLRALELRWHLLTMGEVPVSERDAVLFGDDPAMFGGEAVYFG